MDSCVNTAQANEILATQIDWHHRHHISRSSCLTLFTAVEKSISEGSAFWLPALLHSLLDVHLASHPTGVVQKAGETKQATSVQQSGSFRVIACPPIPQQP